MLDTIRQTLIKRAFLDISYLSPSEIDSLLEKYYGSEWKKVFGLDEPEKSCSPISAYTGKSILQMDEEFFEKEKDERLKKETEEALEKAREEWKKKTKDKKIKILGDKNV